jgi:hypothetical protein
MVDDPALLIGSAKELIESTAKAALLERNLPVNEKDDLPPLVSKAQHALRKPVTLDAVTSRIAPVTSPSRRGRRRKSGGPMSVAGFGVPH